MEQDGYCKETSKKARIEQLLSKLSTACWRRLLLAVQKELVKQGLCERNGMIAFGRIDCWSGEALRRFSVPVDIPDSLDDKWLRWQRLMRQINWVTMLVRRSQLLVWKRPRNELNICVYVLHRPGQCCVQVWISICERWWTRASSPKLRH